MDGDNELPECVSRHPSLARGLCWFQNTLVSWRPPDGNESTTKDVSRHCHRVSLRFRQPVTEGAFLEDRTRTHSNSVQRGAVLAILICVVALIDQPVSSPSPGHGVESHRTMMSVRRAALSCGIALNITVFAAARVVGTSKAIEIITSVLMCFFIVSIVACEPEYIMSALQLDKEKTMGSSYCFEESVVLLAMLGLLTVSHASLHIRWCVVVWVDVTSFIVYLVTSHLREKPPWFNWLVFGCIVTTSSLGTRACEIYERQAFWRALQEKCLRVESEFRMDSQQQLQQRDSQPRDSRSEVSYPETHNTSLPETTDTGLLFNSFGDRTINDIISVGQKEQWLIDAHEIVLHDHRLGAGGFGLVYRGNLSGTPVALKIPRRHGVETKEGLLDFSTELRILRKVRHPNIILFHGACIDEQNIDLFLVLELSDGVKMEAVVAGRVIGPLRDLERFEILLGVSRALCYLHNRSPVIVHGDLKSSNILVELKAKPGFLRHHLQTWTMHPKLLDFGLSRVCTRGAQKCGGTVRWAAPELFAASSKRPSPVVDVFSFGRLIFYTLTGQMPLAGWSREDIVTATEQKSVPPLCWTGKPKLEAALRPSADACMSVAPELRPRMTAVLSTFELLSSTEAYLRQSGVDDGGPSVPSNSDAQGATIWMQVRQCRQAAQQSANQQVGMKRAPSWRNTTTLPQLPELETCVQGPLSGGSSRSGGHGEPTSGQTTVGCAADEEVNGNPSGMVSHAPGVQPGTPGQDMPPCGPFVGAAHADPGDGDPARPVSTDRPVGGTWDTQALAREVLQL